MQKIEEVLGLIKEEDLINLANEYSVDKKNTKILGSLMVKGLIRLILSGQKTSLRMLAMVINMGDETEVTYSGLSKRLKSLNVKYFKAIYENLVNSCMHEFTDPVQQNLYRFDSTIITLTGHVIKDGLRIGGAETDSHIKVSVGLKNQLPATIHFCTDPAEANENVALIRAINESKVEKEDILLFDRGLSSVRHFQDFCQNDYKFVTRIKQGRRYVTIKANPVINDLGDECKITEDSIVQLYGKESGQRKPFELHLRLIKLVNANNDEILFLTNLFDLSAKEIAALYKRRWDIEIFFKFVKQNLGYKHFLSHSTNGMQVYIYMILITAILFLIYKKRSNLSGFKLALFEFSLKVNKLFLKDMIILSGGNLDSVRKYVT